MHSRFREHEEQVAVFRRASVFPHNSGFLREYLWAVPNAGTTGGRRAMLAGARRKAEGVSKGVPDIECCIAMPPYTGLHIELKRADGVPSDVTKEQKEWLIRLRRCGRKAEVAFGQDHAWKILMEYLGIGSSTQ